MGRLLHFFMFYVEVHSNSVFGAQIVDIQLEQKQFM